MKKTKQKLFELPELPELTALQWAILLAVTTLSFLFLLWMQDKSRLVGAVVFTFVPLTAFIFTKRDILKALIRKPSRRDVGIGIGFGFLCVVISMAVTLFMRIAGGGNVASNSVFGMLANSPAETMIAMLIQLFGEELLTLILFLFFFQLFRRCLKTRSTGILLAWLVSAVIFGLLHYPAYLNWAHVICVIGLARLILSLSFLKTKNLTASYISHLTDDFTSVGIVFAVALSSAAGTGVAAGFI